MLMKISVVVASYNYANYIEETIQSVINQTYSDWELIIVDDGSTDNSVEIINKYCNQDNRIRLYTHPNHENKGLKETLLLGISKSTSDWVAFLESDDMWREDYLEKKVEIANKYPEVGFIFNSVEYIGSQRRVKDYYYAFKDRLDQLSELTYPRSMFKDLNVSNKILTFSSVMVKKNLLKKEYFNTPVDKLLDWYLYINILFDTLVYYLNEKITVWRVHEGSYISNKAKSRHIFVHIIAYLDVYKRNKTNKSLLIFAMHSLFLSIISVICEYIRLYSIIYIRKIKKRLGLPLRESPLFDD